MTDDRLLVTIRRPDGTVFRLHVPEEHLQRVLDLACGEFGDKSIILDGPKLVASHEKRK